MSTRRNTGSPEKANTEATLRRSSRPAKRKLTKAESSEQDTSTLSPVSKLSHVSGINTASRTSTRQEKRAGKELKSPKQQTPKSKPLLSPVLTSPRVSKRKDFANLPKESPGDQKVSPTKGKPTVTIPEPDSVFKNITVKLTDDISGKSSRKRQTRHGKDSVSPSVTPISKPIKELIRKTSSEAIDVLKPETQVPPQSSRKRKSSIETASQDSNPNLSVHKMTSADEILQQLPLPDVIKQPENNKPSSKPATKNSAATTTSPLKSEWSQTDLGSQVPVLDSLAVATPLNNQSSADELLQHVIVESVIPDQPVLTEVIRSEPVVTITPESNQNTGDLNPMKNFCSQTDLDNLSIAEERVENCTTKESNIQEISSSDLSISEKSEKTKKIEEVIMKPSDTEPTETNTGSISETMAQIRRKRVASELLEAAEIAHGMLGNKPKAKLISRLAPSVSKQTKKIGVGPEIASKATLLQQGAHDRISTVMKEALTNSDHTEVPENLKAVVAQEKSADEIFESVTAIVKASYISSDKIKTFVLNQIPLLSGVSAVVSPSSHYLLHGSWLSVTRARKSLELYLNGMPKPSGEKNVEQEKSSTKLSDVDSMAVSGENRGISVLMEDATETSTDGTGKLQIMEHDDLESENGDNQELLPGGRVKGLDRNKIQGSVEVYEDHTQGQRTFLCNMCGYSHEDFETVQSHILENHSHTFSCVYCKCLFKAKGQLQQHIKDEHTATHSHVCVLCNKRFANKRYLMTHMKRHSGVKNHQCDTCGRKFFEAHKLRWHMETHKPAAEKNLPYSCSICGRKFYNRSSLSDHQNIHTGARPFECDECDASFSHRIGLKRHMLTHTSERPFPCNTCEKAFKTYKQLEIHEVQHTGQGQHVCDLCTKVFSTQYSLRRHVATCAKKSIYQEHMDTVEQASAVEACAVETGAVETVTVQGDEPPEDETVFMCGVCDKLFSALEEAADHARTHTSADVQIEFGAAAEELETETFTISSTAGSTSTTMDDAENNLVIVSCDDNVESSNDTASKLLNAMTSQQVTLDDTQLVANTLADLSALGQNSV